MSDMKSLIIYQKHYDLMRYSFPIIGRFPKNQRYVLGQQIENVMLDIGKMIVHAIVGQSVDFRDVDGVCNAPYTSAGDMPTEAELRTAIEGVFAGG